MSYRLTFRQMNKDDIPKLKLEEQWMYDRYYACHEFNAAYIVEEGDEAICAFGAIYEWVGPGATEVWFNFIKKRRVLNVCRILKRTLADMARRHGIKRMQAIVRCGSGVNNRFMEFLGFENETPNGMKNKLYNGESAYLYSRCF